MESKAKQQDVHYARCLATNQPQPQRAYATHKLFVQLVDVVVVRWHFCPFWVRALHARTPAAVINSQQHQQQHTFTAHN